MIRERMVQTIAQVPVPICDACYAGYCTDCEGGACACQSWHVGEDWDELKKRIEKK